jgi:hypothetical protein
VGRGGALGAGAAVKRRIAVHPMVPDPGLGTDHKGRRYCASCGLGEDHEVHQVPQQSAEVAEVEARRLGEKRESE